MPVPATFRDDYLSGGKLLPVGRNPNPASVRCSPRAIDPDRVRRGRLTGRARIADVFGVGIRILRRGRISGTAIKELKNRIPDWIRRAESSLGTCAARQDEDRKQRTHRNRRRNLHEKRTVGENFPVGQPSISRACLGERRRRPVGSACKTLADLGVSCHPGAEEIFRPWRPTADWSRY